MKNFSYGVGAHKARRAAVAAAGIQLLLCAHTALAQATQNPSPTADQAPSEAARRAALSPYRFILQNANAPSRKPAPAPAAEPKRQAAPAAVDLSAALPRPAPAAPAASQVNAPAAPAPAPEPPVAALTPKPAEPPPRREIIPVKTDEPRLPAALLRERPSGVVKVRFDIRPDGSTADVKVMASTNRALNRASVDAVTGWKFEPVDEVLTVETELAYKYE